MSDEIAPPKIIYVYTLSDPRTGDVRYVGVTNNPRNRFNSHMRDNRASNHRTRWINSLVRDGLKPIMAIIDETDRDNWAQCEMMWIAHYRSIGCKLVNSTDGGEGATGYVHSEEQRRKIADTQRGKKYSEESRRKMSESQKNRPPITNESRRKMSEASRNHSKESFRKIGDAHRGKKHTDETRRKMVENNTRRRAILQYDKFGNFIQKWDGVIDASKALSIQSAHIVACCKCKRKSAYGSVWRYADDPLLGEYPVQLGLNFDEG